MLRDGGTYVEMGPVHRRGLLYRHQWHRICTKDLNVLALGDSPETICHSASICSTARADKYPWLEMQTLYPFYEEEASPARCDAMAMKDGEIDIVPWPELAE